MVARSARNAPSLQPIPMSFSNPRNHTRARDRPRFLRAPHVCSAMTRRHQLSSHARTTDFAQTSIHAKLALQARRIGHGARLVHRRLVRRSVRGLASRRRAASAMPAERPPRAGCQVPRNTASLRMRRELPRVLYSTPARNEAPRSLRPSRLGFENRASRGPAVSPRAEPGPRRPVPPFKFRPWLPDRQSSK